jgi:uncharacterized protein
MNVGSTYTAFAGTRRIARGPLADVLRRTKKKLDANEGLQVLIFDDATGRQVDFDFHGSIDEVLARVEPPPAEPARTGPGRPKLGVVSREVSLLPRHWEWLEQHPQGISAGIRRLVDEARKREPDVERTRAARAAASRVMWVMAGDLPNFEESSRALFRADKSVFADLVARWPADLRTHLDELLREGGAFIEQKTTPKTFAKKK